MRTLIFLSLMAMVQIAFGQDAMLKPYRWENRLVLLFGSDQDAAVQKQLSELGKDPAGITDRHLLIFHIDRDEVHLVNAASDHALSAQALRKHYSVGQEELRYILIGKDGGVKLNRKDFVPNQSLFAIIDAMPMRQREMREKK